MFDFTSRVEYKRVVDGGEFFPAVISGKIYEVFPHISGGGRGDFPDGNGIPCQIIENTQVSIMRWIFQFLGDVYWNIGCIKILGADIQMERVLEKFRDILGSAGLYRWMVRVCFSIYFSCFSLESSSYFWILKFRGYDLVPVMIAVSIGIMQDEIDRGGGTEGSGIEVFL